MRWLLVWGAALVLAACDRVETTRSRADASYEDARAAAASAGVYLPPQDFLDRHHKTPPAETAPWAVSITRDEMREVDLVKACTASTNGIEGILCVEQRPGEAGVVLSVETSDLIDCSHNCSVAVRFGDQAVRDFNVGGQRTHFILQGRRGVDWLREVSRSDVVFVEAVFERSDGARQQLRFDTRHFETAWAWRPTAEGAE